MTIPSAPIGLIVKNSELALADIKSLREVFLLVTRVGKIETDPILN